MAIPNRQIWDDNTLLSCYKEKGIGMCSNAHSKDKKVEKRGENLLGLIFPSAAVFIWATVHYFDSTAQHSRTLLEQGTQNPTLILEEQRQKETLCISL